MNKLLLIIGAVVLGVIGISFYYSQQPKPQEESKMNANPQTMMSDQSRYVEYSKKALDNASVKRRVLFFYANWCSECRPADANFKENESKIPEDVVVIRVNYNDTGTNQEERNLAKKYDVIYQHTFVQIDEQGNKIIAWNGGQIDELLNNIK
jgi:thiol-disulfide isomerase/thioredoxin